MIGELAMRVTSGSDGWGPGQLVIAAVHLVVFVEVAYPSECRFPQGGLRVALHPVA